MRAREKFFRQAGAGQLSLSFAGSSENAFELRPIQPSPCAQACPAGVNVKGYVGLIAAGRFEEALELVRRANPFPAICGRVCHHPCESFCRRSEIDEPVAICALKRFIADYEMAQPRGPVQRLPQTRPQRVAVIGSGPAGLTAASDLARMGFSVTVFEAHSEAGGMLVLGIPEYRLPRDVIRAEIQRILDFGVKLRTGFRVGEDHDLLELLSKERFDAAFVAVGAQLPRRLDIPGEDGEGVEDCLTFMRRVNAGTWVRPASRVLVLGGGHSAIDCARSALRLGSESVQVVYRRSRAEMPAGQSEVQQAEQEGVAFSFLESPKRVLRNGGVLQGLELIRTRLGDPDESGRRRPVEVPGSEFSLEADLILSAVGQKPDLRIGGGASRFRVSPWGTVHVNKSTLATSLQGVFAGGDAVTGPRTVIEAIAQGHRAARSIARHLDPKARFTLPADALNRESRELELESGSDPPLPRTPMPRLPADRRRRSFREVNLGFSQEMAVKEAQRCLRCGPCAECSLCVTSCPKRQFLLTVDHADKEWEALVRIASNGPELSGFSGALLHSKRRQPAEARLSCPASWVNSDLCRGCGVCVENCDYGAIRLVPGPSDVSRAEVLGQFCKGCGVCVALCPTNAMQPGWRTDAEIAGRLRLPENRADTVVFTCRWNPLAERLSTRVAAGVACLSVPCAGRLHPGLILEAFQSGAQRVAAVTCEPARCHYGFGSRQASESLGRAGDLLHLLGVERSRFRLLTVEEDVEVDAADLLSGWEKPPQEVASD